MSEQEAPTPDDPPYVDPDVPPDPDEAQKDSPKNDVVDEADDTQTEEPEE